MEQTKSNIGLAIIVKDDSEINELKRCVNSVKDYVGGVYITATNELSHKIKKWCKKNGYSYSYFQWVDDFAAARNYNNAQVKEDVILWLDVDDVVRNPEELPNIEKMFTEGGTDWVSIEYKYATDKYGNVIVRQPRVRLFRKGTGKWIRRIHETLVNTQLIKGEELSDQSLIIDHQTTDERQDSSTKRNLRILHAELEEQEDKVDPTTLYYLGQTYFADGNYEKSLEYFMQYLPHEGWEEARYNAMNDVAVCLTEMGKFEQAINMYLMAIKIQPKWPLAYYQIADVYLRQGKYDKVVTWIRTGMTKKRPPTRLFTNDLDYTLNPLGRLAYGLLYTGEYEEAHEVAKQAYKINPKVPEVKEALELTRTALETENFVESLLITVDKVRTIDRLSARTLLAAVPPQLQEDYRIQEAHKQLNPPKTWSDKSIVIYCGKSAETWAYPAIYTGIGGSEEAVINMSSQLAKLGFEVTVYNSCGDEAGNYHGVEYVPFFHFDERDNFNTIISWRNPALFVEANLKAKKKLLWLHDIAYPDQFSPQVFDEVDKVMFLSKWHRNNLPDLPEDKVFITNNGIDPADFQDKPKKKPNSLFWGSSYDRGLLTLVKDILPMIQKEIPDVHLDVCYGWTNIERDMEQFPELKKLHDELAPLLENNPAITHHGRVSHQEVARLVKEALVLPYSSEFGETNMITSQKSQAAGCYVIMPKDAGGAPERVKFGEVLQHGSIYTSKSLQKIFARAVVDYLKAPKKPSTGLLEAFSWAETAKQWKKELL